MAFTWVCAASQRTMLADFSLGRANQGLRTQPGEGGGEPQVVAGREKRNCMRNKERGTRVCPLPTTQGAEARHKTGSTGCSWYFRTQGSVDIRCPDLGLDALVAGTCASCAWQVSQSSREQWPAQAQALSWARGVHTCKVRLDGTRTAWPAASFCCAAERPAGEAPLVPGGLSAAPFLGAPAVAGPGVAVVRTCTRTGLRRPARARSSTSRLCVAEKRPVRRCRGSSSSRDVRRVWKPMSRRRSASSRITSCHRKEGAGSRQHQASCPWTPAPSHPCHMHASFPGPPLCGPAAQNGD